jgi:hypothetical protein
MAEVPLYLLVVGALDREQQEQEDRDWGANKKAYYADGDSEEASDEEAAAAEVCE